MQPPARLISVLLLTDRQDFQRAQEQSARDAGGREGLNIEVAFADNSPFVQIQQVLGYVSRPAEVRPTAIAIESAGSPAAFARVARKALSAGVGWVELSAGPSMVESLCDEFPGSLVGSVTVDEDAIGHLQASQCRALLPEGGALLYVEGPGVNAIVTARRRALEEGLEGTSITIAKTLAADWTEEGARVATSSWLRKPSARRCNPALVCSQNDAMAIGVRKSATDQLAPWALVPSLGCDGLPEAGQRYLKEGVLAATILKPTTAGPGVEWLARAMRGEAPPHHLVLHPSPLPPLEQLDRLAQPKSRKPS